MLPIGTLGLAGPGLALHFCLTGGGGWLQTLPAADVKLALRVGGALPGGGGSSGSCHLGSCLGELRKEKQLGESCGSHER